MAAIETIRSELEAFDFDSFEFESFDFDLLEAASFEGDPPAIVGVGSPLG
jgi:hypothetical protein